jgi:Secretion system C-terminal sorting domain
MLILTRNNFYHFSKNQLFMKKRSILVFSLIVSTLVGLQAQRYLTPQFSGATRSTAIYGQNFTILPLLAGGRFTRQPLVCDIYQPTGDTASGRPLMIFMSTSNFLPKSVRRNPLGDRRDSVAVEMCNRFAKLGYVTAAIDYRQGWNPIAQPEASRTAGLINAAYRGIQDVRTAIRFFKLQAAALKIDTSRIMVIGEGTGGYLAMGAASLNTYNKILSTKYPAGKFITVVGGNPIPMVIEAYNGNVWGTKPDTATISPVGFPYPVGDTLFVPNYGTVSTGHRLTVNMGGAIGDATWLDSLSTPLISVACPHDQNAPYRDGVLGVGIGGGQTLPVLRVQGSHWISQRADSLGINKVFEKLSPAYDPYKAIARSRNDTRYYQDTFNTYGPAYATSLFPIIGRSRGDSAPYQWWSTDTSAANPGGPNPWGLDSAALAGNPGMSAVKARLYLDSIMTFIVPRACLGLDLKPCAGVVSGTREVLALNAYLKLAPNPATNEVRFESEEINPMRAIELYDISGRMVAQQTNINTSNFTMQRNGLPQGIYVAKVRFDSGVLAKKLMFEE